MLHTYALILCNAQCAYCAYICIYCAFSNLKGDGTLVGASRWSLLAQCWFRWVSFTRFTYTLTRYMYRCIDMELYTLVCMVVEKWQIVSKRRALNRQAMEWHGRYAMVYYGIAWCWHGTLLVYQCLLWHSLVLAWYAGFRYATISNGVM